ncbi:MAG: hypothetical protein WC415_02115 [Patescibacteria group bacterium]|jgi:hypothetical protein
MFLNKNKNLFYAIAFIILAIVFAFPVLAAWQNPANGTVPPANNLDTPINVGSATQTKVGGLNISGSVGIGVVAPLTNLEVKGTSGNSGVLTVSGGNTNITAVGQEFSSLQFRSADTSILATNDMAGKIASIAEYSNGALAGLAFYTADNSVAPYLNERMRISNTGNVGIASTSPLYPLSVDGAVYGARIALGDGRIKGLSSPPTSGDEAASKAYVDSLVGSSIPSASGVSGYTLRSNGTNWVSNNLLYNDGTNVGIGTTNPGSYKLNVAGNGIFSDTLVISNNTEDKTLFHLAGADVDKWIGFSGHGMHIGTDSYGHSSVYLGPKGSTSGTLNSSVYVNWANAIPTRYNRWIINATPSSGSISGYANNGSTVNTLINSMGDSYFNIGNVGIGTTNPTEKLDVVGNGKFSGDLSVDGQINLGGGDAAEEFIADENYPAGTVLVMNDGGFKNVTACFEKYDSGVVGVVSDQASVVMGKVDSDKKVVIALVGVVPVKVNDSSGRIKKGDLLTTSATTGEAMRAVDLKIGTIIGKALEDATPGHSEIQVLINLQ